MCKMGGLRSLIGSENAVVNAVLAHCLRQLIIAFPNHPLFVTIVSALEADGLQPLAELRSMSHNFEGRTIGTMATTCRRADTVFVLKKDVAPIDKGNTVIALLVTWDLGD